MKKSVFLLLFCTFQIWAIAQQQNYFQQEVNYTIEATLNDSIHSLTGTIEIEYINHSPHQLEFIYFHLWPNAYKNRSTAFAKQQLQQGSTRFYYAEDKDLGSISQLAFTVDGQTATLTPDAENPDIAILNLPKPLPSGGKITIRTPFVVDIPNSFSRLGHVEQSYQMTQWYPKPAVYDHKGWHPMPYLDQGEFYSEFGSFDVTLTLPANYVVGATGVLQTESEKQFLQQRVEDTEAYFRGETLRLSPGTKFPASSDTMKTIRYTAENVHDFAWFADKRFRVLRGSVSLPSGQKVDTWVMFTWQEEQLWKDAIKYVNRSVEFYSDKVGPYPYPHATAVQSALSAGAGMEYPMITVIGLSGTAKALDEVITHEVGHNWFYGILAFNERDHPWMDEGINSYYENRYMRTYYGSGAIGDALPKFLTNGEPLDVQHLLYLFQARRGQDQAPETHSADFSSINYGLGAYFKPALIFRQLENYLGTAVYDAIMRSFYEKWKFRHPYPEDLRQHLEQESGKDLSWVFDGFLYSTHTMDYAITGVRQDGRNLIVSVKNKGEVAAPFPISAIQNDTVIVETQWYEGFRGTQELTFPSGSYDRLVLDAQRITLDIDSENNSARTTGIFKTLHTPSLKFGASLNSLDKPTLYFLPALGWNDYDKMMLGLAFYNRTAFSKPLEFALVPMYSFRSGDLVGIGSIKYNFFPHSSLFQRITLEVGGRTFNYGFDNHYKYFNKFYKLAPKIEVEFANTATSSLTHTLSYRYVNIWQEYGVGVNRDSLFFRTEKNNYQVHEVQYVLEKESALTPMNLSFTAHQGKGFTKLFAHLQQDFSYAQPRKKLELHAFAGVFANFDAKEVEAGLVSLQLSGITGPSITQRDYLFDEVLLARSVSTSSSNFFARQIYYRDANLKTLSNVGASTDWMLGLGLRTTIPGPLPVRPYVDAAIAPGAFYEDDISFIYSAGVALPIVPDVLEIYFPILESDTITEGSVYQIRESFWDRISFRINFTKLNPFNLINNLSF